MSQEVNWIQEKLPGEVSYQYTKVPDIQISPEIDIDGGIVIGIDTYAMINNYCNLFLYIGIDTGSGNGYQKRNQNKCQLLYEGFVKGNNSFLFLQF